MLCATEQFLVDIQNTCSMDCDLQVTGSFATLLHTRGTVCLA